MKTSTSLILAGLLFGAACSDANASNFAGKFDIAQTNSSSTTSTRYYNAAAGLSIYAPAGASADLLREAYFRKVFVNVSYTAIACPGGVSGTCGQLFYITVDALNIP